LQLRTHAPDPVPFAWYGLGVMIDKAEAFSERKAAQSSLQITDGYQLMEQFIGRKVV